MDLKLFKELIKKYIGLDLNAYKEVQLNRRLEYFIEKNNIKDFEAYCSKLKVDSVERENFISYVTINVTRFFRDIVFFNHLEVELKKYSKDFPIKIWSAACSYGCEPYTLAIILEELGFKNYTIIATDLDIHILELAKEGVYMDFDLKDVPNEYLNKYFTKKGDKFIVNESLKKRIQFKRHNLLLNDYDSGYDVIVCRNVVIYFTNEAKQGIYERFYESLKNGGMLFVGPTEYITNYRELNFSQIQPCIYKK